MVTTTFTFLRPKFQVRLLTFGIYVYIFLIHFIITPYMVNTWLILTAICFYCVIYVSLKWN